MTMSVEIASFLLQRTPRDIHFLTLLIERLDQASLAAQRRLTIPFVREILKL
jgi:DnaA family protein